MDRLEIVESGARSFDGGQGVPESIYSRFLRVKTEGLSRTQLEAGRLESFFPIDLKSAYKLATGKGAEKLLQNAPEAGKMVDYLERDIFAILPDYKAPIDLAHINGFMINGVLRNIFMDRNIARKEIQNAVVGVKISDLVKRAMEDFGKALKISPTDLSRAVSGTLNSGANRQWVTNIVKTAQDMRADASNRFEL